VGTQHTCFGAREKFRPADTCDRFSAQQFSPETTPAIETSAMASTNQELARIFEQMAEVTEVLGGNQFRVNAFRNTGRMLSEMTEDAGQFSEKELRDLHGIGKGGAQRIREYVETGKIEEHQELMSQVPVGVLDLLEVPNLGPKTIMRFWQEAGVTDLDTLKQKLESGELKNLKGFGEKKLQQIQNNLAFADKSAQRTKIGNAMPVAEWFTEQLRALKAVQQAAYAGSLRRGKETVGDLDLLVAAESQHGPKIAEHFVGLGPVAEVILKGATKTSIRAQRGLQIDLRVVEPDSFGAALMYFTGSKEHNVALRGRANDRGYKLSEYGLFEEKTDRFVAGRTEEEVYHALELAWIPPELREDHGEIEMAEQSLLATQKTSGKKAGKKKKTPKRGKTSGSKARGGGLPELLELSQVKAELHAHTTASDGHWSIEEFAEHCAARGYHTIAVTDHSKSQTQASGLSDERLEQHIEAVHEAAENLKGKIQILAGAEVDILSDGKLDYPDSLLKELDIVVASPHAALQQEADKATPRLLKAIENPCVTIIGHPTGRIINKRSGIQPDMPKVIEAAAERGIALEINANHNRLDLRDSHARTALEAGAKLAINTDAHGPRDLEQLRYGVLTARRAGATAEQVINTLSRQQLRKWLASSREKRK
jgi:DNA polymerase (family 10)